jgi:hypothetical protein
MISPEYAPTLIVNEISATVNALSVTPIEDSPKNTRKICTRNGVFLIASTYPAQRADSQRMLEFRPIAQSVPIIKPIRVAITASLNVTKAPSRSKGQFSKMGVNTKVKVIPLHHPQLVVTSVGQ